MKILAIRNDKLGDFMLIFPALSLIRNMFPQAVIYALIPEYTRPMAELCPWIDEVIIDSKDHSLAYALNLSRQLKDQKFDAVIDFHPESYTALAIFISRIPHRFAPASRLLQVLYNHRLKQRRSRSEKPEYQYNIDLAASMSACFEHGPMQTDEPPYLEIQDEQRNILKNTYLKSLNINSNKKIVMIHPGTGGSAVNLVLEDYAKLIRLLAAHSQLHFIITAGPGEETTANTLANLLQGISFSTYVSSNGLKVFTEFISIADIFISGSTGVLHIAGALDVPTVAFYPARRSATSLRWQTLNSNGRHLAFSSNTIDSNHIDLDMTECYRAIYSSYLYSDSDLKQ